jgi:hypothetical protein
MRRRTTGGVFGEIDRLKAKFEADKKRLPALIEKRLGRKRAVRIIDTFWTVRFNHRTYRGLTPAALLKALPKHGVRPPPAEKPPELPLGGPADV